MAKREIRIAGDKILDKPCREVKELTEKEQILIDDMIETMNDAQGVGLAAPQVGILKQIAVVDIGDGPVVMINPVIVETEGEQTGDEGCLSVPDKVGTVTRPMKVRVEAYDREMKKVTIEGEELMARALCHEIDHLGGKLYTSIAVGPLREVVYEDDDIEEIEE